MNTLFTSQGQTDVHTLVAVAKFFAAHPDGRVKVGVWPEDAWDAEQFNKWFWQCLMEKIASHDTRTGRKMTRQYQTDLRLDAQVINEFYGRRIVRRGCNILCTQEMKRLYPHINTNLDN